MNKAMWSTNPIRKRVMRTFKISLSAMELIETFFITAGSFIISLSIPLILGYDKLLMVCIMITLLIHELGHCTAMRYFCCEKIRIRFFFLIAITTTTSIIESRFKRIVVSLAGPVPGIVFGSLIFIFGNYLPDQVKFFATTLVYINTLNLVPVAVLDGGSIFESLFIPGSNKKVGIFNMITGIGSFILCLLNKDYFILWLCLLIILRGIVFFRHRKEPPIIKYSDCLKSNQKIVLTAIWLGAVIIGIISLY